jgi:predicted lactoylglutathione lyase
MSAEKKARLVNLCPVFPSPDIQRTVQFYTEKLGFYSAKHYDKVENFATLYRDEIEFVIIQAQKGQLESNLQRYGAGYDAYIDPASHEEIELLYNEFLNNGVKILTPPHMTEYGSYEFVFEDIDGRRIGVGRVFNPELYFKNSNLPG